MNDNHDRHILGFRPASLKVVKNGLLGILMLLIASKYEICRDDNPECNAWDSNELYGLAAVATIFYSQVDAVFMTDLHQLMGLIAASLALE